MASLKGTAIKRARTKKTDAEAETINSLPEQANEDLPMSPGDKLCEDELTITFSSYWISTKDMLNFRLVNKRWRDAATTALLQRDACYVTLDITTVKGGDRAESCYWNGGDKKKLKTPKLLTELMSNSPKFPVTHFRIHTCHLTGYADSEDLVLFFKLHGEKIKSLSPFCRISKQQLLHICFTYAPKLECLDLSCAGTIRLSPHIQDNDEMIQLKWPSKPLPITSIIFGHSGVYYKDYNAQAYQAFMHLLLSSQSNLSRIDAKLIQLADVLDAGKGNLIRSLDFYNVTGSKRSITLVKKYLELSPKLSKLSLDLSCFELCKTTLAPINALIRSSRNTLRDLKIEYSVTEEGTKFQIPPMKHLKKLTLWGFIRDSSNPREVFHLFKFKNGTPGKKYFPSLLTVRIEVASPSIKTSLASFFHDSPENIFSNVDVLEVRIKCLAENWLKNFKLNLTLFSTAFPNLRMIKIKCDQIRFLTSLLWMLHSLEFIEICNISKNYKAPADFRLVPFVDNFFTGFGVGMCRKLQSKKLPKHMDNPRTLAYLQLRPSICDLPNLKELKLKFSADFSVQFASKVTADYAFSKMPDTKFFVSYDPDELKKTADMSDSSDSDSDDSFLENASDSDDDYCNYWDYGRKIDDDSDADEYEVLPAVTTSVNEYYDEHEQYEELCFGPIKPYVQIVREKQCH